jgi:rod shape-determining protein MreB
MIDWFFGLFSRELGIDLGTANTLVLVKGKGIVIREPSYVARHKKRKQILAVGREAKRMVGRTPESIVVTRPLKDGVISDFEIAQAMLAYFINKVHETPGFLLPKIPRPKVVIGIPSGITEVEARAVQEACLRAGARQAFLVEEPMAAAIGAGLPIEAPEGTMVVDIGGGTSEIAVISLGGIVVNRSLRVAGDEMDEAIIEYCRKNHTLLLGEATAEEVKMAVAAALPLKKELTTVVRGRNLKTGLPKSVKLSSKQINEALRPVILLIVEAISDTIQDTPPELVSDIFERGVVLTGGGSLLRGLDKIVAQETKMPVWRADDPMTCVVRGCGKILEDKHLLEKVKVVGGLRG